MDVDGGRLPVFVEDGGEVLIVSPDDEKQVGVYFMVTISFDFLKRSLYFYRIIVLPALEIDDDDEVDIIIVVVDPEIILASISEIKKLSFRLNSDFQGIDPSIESINENR